MQPEFTNASLSNQRLSTTQITLTVRKNWKTQFARKCPRIRSAQNTDAQEIPDRFSSGLNPNLDKSHRETSEKPMQSKPIILVADDEDANRRLLSEILKRAGYDVICTEDGDRALRVVREEPVSVAVLDVNMPGKSGLSACATIKSEPKTRLLPVVLVTALSSTEDRI